MKEKRVNQLKKRIVLTFEKAKALGINLQTNHDTHG